MPNPLFQGTRRVPEFRRLLTKMNLSSIIIAALLVFFSINASAETFDTKLCAAVFSLASQAGPIEKRQKYKNEAIVFIKIMAQYIETEDKLKAELENAAKSLKKSLDSKSEEERIEFMRSAGYECRVLMIAELHEITSKNNEM
jgi:hypothetical protein